MENIWYSLGDVFSASLQELWWGFIQFVPMLILAIIVFIIGWWLAGIVGKAFQQVVSAVKVDKLLESAGAGEIFRKAGMNLNSGYFIGQLVRWFIIIAFFITALSLVGLNDISYFLKEDVLGYLPRVIIAVFILIVATVVADAVSRAINAGAKSMSITSANMLGAVAKYAIWIFAFIIALGQLGIAEYYMNVLFTGIVAMLALGGALAFGLGAKDQAGRLISKLGEEMKQ